MKLLKLYIENYGKISKTEYNFNGDLTTFCYENGYGKSTIANFIKAMFYGLPKVTTASKFNDREHYFPFNGGKFGGNLTYEINGDVYKIVRFFDKKSETKDEFTLYKNDNVVDTPLESLGKNIFAVDEQSFMRTLFFEEAFNEDLDASDLTFKLTGIVENSEEGFENAKKRLDEAQKNLKKTGKKGELYALDDDIFKIKQEIESLKSVENSIQFKYKERAEIKLALENAELERKRVSDLKIKQNEFNVYNRYLSEAEEYKSKAEKLKEIYPVIPTESDLSSLYNIYEDIYKVSIEIEKGKHSETGLMECEFNKSLYFKTGIASEEKIANYKKDLKEITTYEKENSKKKIKNYPLFVIGILEAVVGVVLLFLSYAYGIAFLACAVSFIMASIFTKNDKQSKNNQDKINEITNYLNSFNIKYETLEVGLFILQKNIEEHKEIEKMLEEKRENLERLNIVYKNCLKNANAVFVKYGIEYNGLDSLNEQIKKIERDLSQITAYLNLYETTLAKAEKYKSENSVSGKVEIVSSYDEIQSKCKELSEKLSALNMVIKNSEDMLESLPDKYNELKILEEKQEKLKLRYQDLSYALNFLKSAEETLKNKYINPVKDTFVYYADKLEKVLGEKVIMDKKFMVYYEKNGENKSRKHLSSGQSVLCDLCLRLALIDNMYKGKSPFIILDDPFISLDEMHIENALKLIKLLSKDRQIIYFTCHKSRNYKT